MRDTVRNGIGPELLRWLMAGLMFSYAADAACAQATPAYTGAADPGRSNLRADAFTLRLEILLQPTPSYRLAAQDWARALQQLGHSASFRTVRGSEQMGVSQKVVAGKAYVICTAGLDARRRCLLNGRAYALEQVSELAQFLDELKKYGPGGPPKDRPQWGLSPAEFGTLTKLLAQPASDAVSLEGVVPALETVGIPAQLSISYSQAARRQIAGVFSDSASGVADLSGLSVGTGLAIILSDYGLGFRPERQKDGSLKLVIDAGGEGDNLWPVGWKSQESAVTVLPGYFKRMPVELTDVPVEALIEVVAGKLEIPHYYSSHALSDLSRPLTEATYSRNASQLSPFKLLSILEDRFELGVDLRTDEAGSLFLWVTTGEEAQYWRERFSHIRQQP